MVLTCALEENLLNIKYARLCFLWTDFNLPPPVYLIISEDQVRLGVKFNRNISFGYKLYKTCRFPCPISHLA